MQQDGAAKDELYNWSLVDATGSLKKMGWGIGGLSQSRATCSRVLFCSSQLCLGICFPPYILCTCISKVRLKTICKVRLPPIFLQGYVGN